MTWNPIATAPKDGTPVWLCDGEGDAGGPFPMRWNPNGSSWFQAGFGVWELEGGGLTWTEDLPDGSPTHWALRTSDLCPSPPWVVLQ
jgi:hypothetical protein